MDVEQLLTKKKVTYTIRGNDALVNCLNPEHEDRNPSMRIDRITGVYNCLSCGFKGNVFSLFDEKANFLEIKRHQFRKAIETKRSESIGLDMPKGFIPFSREWRNVSSTTLALFGAFQHHEHAGRLVFPIHSISGKIVAFNGRSMSPDVTPRYMLSPPDAKIPLYPAKVSPLKGSVILVEGIFDMLNIYDKGLTNAVCTFGTEKVTKDKLAIIKVQGVSNIDILFDPDEAGLAAAEKVKDLVEEMEMTSRVIRLKSGDPGDLTARQVIKLKEKLYGD